MQKSIHPENHKATVKCACGNVCEIMTTQKGDTQSVDICSACHPFFTKKQKIVDAGGRVEKFQKKMVGTAAKTTAKAAPKKAADDKKGK